MSLPGTQPGPLHPDLSHFRHSLYLACWVFSAAVLAQLPWLAPSLFHKLWSCSPASHLRLLCSQLQFLTFIPRMGLECHQYSDIILTAAVPPQPQNCTSHLSWKIISLSRGWDGRQEKKKAEATELPRAILSAILGLKISVFPLSREVLRQVCIFRVLQPSWAAQFPIIPWHWS